MTRKSMSSSTPVDKHGTGVSGLSADGAVAGIRLVHRLPTISIQATFGIKTSLPGNQGPCTTWRLGHQANQKIADQGLRSVSIQ